MFAGLLLTSYPQMKETWSRQKENCLPPVSGCGVTLKTLRSDQMKTAIPSLFVHLQKHLPWEWETCDVKGGAKHKDPTS